MITYAGVRTKDGCFCFVLGDGFPINARNDVRNHSPDGFEWGYGGSGPAQLALAILCDLFGEKIARKYYQAFKWDVIAKFEGDMFDITSHQITEWLVERLEEQKGA